MNKPCELKVVDGKNYVTVAEEARGKLSTFGLQYLQEHGFFNDLPSDQEGYTPWYTYPAIAYLKDILTKQHKVLEYGSGYSTLFYKERVGSLFTVEHDLEWAKKIVALNGDLSIEVCVPQCKPVDESFPKITEFLQTINQIRSNNLNNDATHGLINNDFAGYASQIYRYPKGYFDIVVIDGMARMLCAFLAAEMINENGIIILDNSDRWQYNNIQTYLTNNGYGRIDFWGPGHGVYERWCTSFFSKNYKIKSNFVERPVIEGPILR